MVRWCFSGGGGDGWLLAIGLSFKWLLAMVGLLDLVVVGGCVDLMEEEREVSFIVFGGVVYIILMSFM